MTQHSPSTCSPQPGDKFCWNCKTTQSPLWRKFSPTIETPELCTPSTPSTTYLCNKCGLFYKRNKKQRPLELDGISSGDSSPSIISSPKKKKSTQSTTTTATTTAATTTTIVSTPKRRQSSASVGSELPLSTTTTSTLPKVEEKKKRKRTTTNASVTCLPTSISSLVNDSSMSTSSQQSINSPVPPPQQSLSNQYLPQPAKRRLLSPPENISTQPTLENLYSTTSINTTCNIISSQTAVVGICSEDLDALISEPSKKTKQANNSTYRGFGSPIISSYSSNATFTTPTIPPSTATTATTTFNAPLTYTDASTLAQIFNMYFQQPQNTTAVNYTTPSTTHLYNTFAFGGISTESTNNTYPHHIVDWYSNENEACTMNPFGDSDFLNNDQFLSEQDLFGEEPNKM